MSSGYAAAREELRRAEVELMLQRERVAAMRRALPPGPIVDDYRFEGSEGPVSLTELLGDDARPLVLYHFMFGGRQQVPCPMCSLWTDGWAAVAHHLAPTLDLALVTSAPIDETLALAHERGWESVRWVSAAATSFKRDIGGEDDDGKQSPFLSVYRRDAEGPRLTWSGGAHLGGEHWRGVDLLSPVWHFLDLTPAGRGDWMPSADRDG